MKDKIINYLKESIGELKKVNWISLKDTQKLTLNVILFSLLFVFIYGILDFIFSRFIFFLR